MDVYALSDPRTKEIRYVGMAKNAYRRYAQHLLEPHPNKDKDAWMEELKEAGTAPILAILESGIDESAVREREKYWIQYYLSQGASLTNIHHVSITLTNEEDSFLEDYMPACRAAEMLSEKLGYPVPPRYVRQLAKRKKQPVRTQSLGYHQLYNRDDILASNIKEKSHT